MRSRIAKTFVRLRRTGRKAFIPYVMAGDPSLDTTRDMVLLLEDCGADIIELGVPFSDPLADGPTIQRAAERALRAGTTLRKVISFVSSVRQRTSVPIVLMTYANPVFRYGIEPFVADTVTAGVDGVIVPDLPPDEAMELIRASRRRGLDTIFLVAPTSTKERIQRVVKASRGFIYYVSITGITGANLLLDGSLERSIAVIRTYTDRPVAVGFGVSRPDDALAIAKVSDGVIVGSAIVRRMHEDPGSLRNFLTELRGAIA